MLSHYQEQLLNIKKKNTSIFPSLQNCINDMVSIMIILIITFLTHRSLKHVKCEPSSDLEFMMLQSKSELSSDLAIMLGHSRNDITCATMTQNGELRT